MDDVMMYLSGFRFSTMYVGGTHHGGAVGIARLMFGLYLKGDKTVGSWQSPDFNRGFADGILAAVGC